MRRPPPASFSSPLPIPPKMTFDQCAFDRFRARNFSHRVPVVEAEARLQRLQPATITAALKIRHNAKNAKYNEAYLAEGHTFVTLVISSRGPIHPEAQRLLYFIAAATTRQHMHYYTTDLKYETVMARNIQRVNAVASAAIGLGIAVRARG